MINQVSNGNAIPVLERLMQFAGRRHEIISHNIANISTPNYQMRDVSVADFQAQLGEAIDERREASGNRGGDLELESTRQVQVRGSALELHAEPMGDGILFHDGNDRDPERLMQDLVENFMAFRTAGELLKGRYKILRAAIRGQA